MPLLLLLATALRAELPMPTFPACGEPDRPDLCPDDLREYWPMISYIPAGSRDTVRPAELEIGSGQGEDRAWRVTTGRWDVMLAVADSGVDWADSGYRSKIALNLGELPLPQLADHSEAADYDVDGNGLVNVQDYAQDPRVAITAGVDVADHHLDASDLIHTFSDGVDDDDNGFVDDIAGWDFYGDDNDPFSTKYDDYGTHGSGVIEEMAAEGNDGDGEIGACPTCSVLPLRVGDSFITDGSRVAMAILYAADRGAAAMNMSLGALTRPGMMDAAIAYARDREMNLVSVTGDENSYHHNQPAMLEGMLYVHSVRPDQDDEENGVYSYLNFLNCNNFGPRVDLVAVTPACATGAAAITTGVIGLVKSAAKDRGLTLTDEEVVAILTGTVDDVWLSEEEREEAQTYPSGEGWDPFYGYGRVSAWKAVQAVVDGAIPPMAEIRSPRWFDPVDPDAGEVVIDGQVSAPRSSGVSWTLEYGTGWDPRDWTAVSTGSGPVEGELGRLDVSALGQDPVGLPARGEGILERVERVFAPAVTLRVRATDAEGRTTEARKTFFVHHDPDLLAGFPVNLGASGESSPIVTDLDGDGVFEVVVADADGRVHALDGAGAELPGFPLVTPTHPRFHLGQPAAAADLGYFGDGAIATVAVGDLEGDGTMDVVLASGTGRVYVWDATGNPRPGFPVEILGREPEEFDDRDSWDNGIAGAPTLADLDGDGSLEILVAGLDQRIYVWEADGAPFAPYPVEVCYPGHCEEGERIVNSPTVGDVDGDGDLDLALGTNEAVNGGNDSVSYAFDALTGTLLPGWPLAESGLVNEAALLPIVGEGHPASMAFADLDGDGDLEIASPIMLGQNSLYHHDGSEAVDLSWVSSDYGAAASTTEPSFAILSQQPAFGDLTGDGVPEYVSGGTGTYYLIALAARNHIDYQHVVAAWDGATGAMLPGFPQQVEDLQFLTAPAVADVSGDGRAEVILGSGGYLLHGYDADGASPEGWPKFTGHWILGSPAVGDLDGDGYLEVVVSTREGFVWAWSTRGRADQAVQWASIHHDPWNTGNYQTPLEPQAGPPGAPPLPSDEGCCSKKEGGSEALALLGPVALLARWRRKR